MRANIGAYCGKKDKAYQDGTRLYAETASFDSPKTSGPGIRANQ
jgi:hypothetical protein